MEEYKLRVVQEKDALDLKLGALNNFLRSAVFDTLPIAEQELLRKQHVAMVIYSDTLKARISRWQQNDQKMKN